MADDYRNTFNGAGALGSLVPGGSASGAIEVQYDQDIFAISLVAGRTYTFTMQGASSGFTLADPSFYLRDATGSAIGFSSGAGGSTTDDKLIFTARASGTFYVDTFGGGGTGTYGLLADTGFVDDYRDTYSDTNEALGSLALGGSTSGTIETQYDQDILAVSLVAGRTYTFTMQGASSGFTLADPSFYLRDAAGSAIGFSTGAGGSTTDDKLIFTARATGTFYIDTFGGGGTGTYRVLADTGFVDDYRDTYNDTNEALGSLALGGSRDGTIETAYDQDIFAISLTAGQTYTFDMKGTSSGFTLADPSFYLRDAAGSAVGFSSGVGGSSTDDRLVFTVNSSGTYYIDTFGGGGTGTYRIAAAGSFTDDYRDTYNDTNEALGSLSPGGTRTGSIEVANDQDIFAISLTAGRTYTLNMQGASSGFTLADPSFYLRDATGTAIGFSTGAGGSTTDDKLVFTARATGTYYVDAFGGGGTGTYRVLADAGYVDDYRDTYNDTIEALGSLAPGGSTTGIIEIASDRDVFAISLVAGQSYTFNMQGASSGFTLADPSLYLRDATGTAVGFSTGVGGSSTDDRLVFTATSSGTYYLDAFASAGTGSYRIVASAGTGAPDDYRDTYNDGSEPLGSLSAGQSKTGRIGAAGDKDVFAITLAAGQTYSFDLSGTSSGGAALSDAFLRLLNGSGTQLLVNNDFNSSNSHLTFKAVTSGTYYLEAGSAATTGTGNYLISAATGYDDYRDTYNGTGTLGSLAVNGQRYGTVEVAGDDDVFAITLTAGQTYSFDLLSTYNGGAVLNDAYLRLLNASGTQLLVNNDFNSNNSHLTFKAVTSGTYYLEAGSATTTGTGNYLISAKTGYDDYRDTYNGTGTLASLAVNGQRYGTVEVAGDDDVFAITLTAGQTYSFDLLSTYNGGAVLNDAYLRLLNASGTQLLANNDFNSNNSHLTFKAVTTGTYYLEAGSASTTGTGNYLITAKTDYDDYRDTYNGTGTLASLAVNGQRYGTVELAGDKDVFAITLTAGQTYSFDLLSTYNGGAVLNDAYLRLLNASGTQLLANNDFNSNNSHLTFKAVTTGTYYLEAGSASTTGTGNYLITAKTDYDDYRDTYNGTGALPSLAVNGQRYGTVELAGDKDVFAITLTAGQTYSFDLLSTYNGGAVLNDAYLRLLNSSGAQVLVNDDFNSNNSHLTFKAVTTGTYYLEAGSATTTGTGNYLISAKTGYDDYRDTYNGAGTLPSLAVNGQRYGTVELAGDDDVFAITLTAGRSYTFDAVGSTNGGAALSNPHLGLYGSSGTLLQANDDFNSLNSRVVYTATTTGTYYLKVESTVASGTGNYLISAKERFDDHADTITDPASPLGILSIGANRLGTIETVGDMDVFRFNLVAGHTYSMRAEGPGTTGSLSDPELHLFNGAGTIIAYNDDANGTLDPEILYTATTSGVHYLEISGIKNAVGGYQIGVFDLV